MIGFRRVSKGLYLVRVKLGKVFLVDAILGSISSTVKSAVSVSNTVCIQMPKRAIILYLTLQKELFLLPFRVCNKVVETLVKNPLSLLFRVYERATEKGPEPVELLTGEKNPSIATIQREFLEVRKAAMKVIRKENRTRWQLQMYRKELDKWTRENEKKTEDMFRIGTEEKELFNAVTAALRYLESLRLKREKMNDCLRDNLKKALKEGTISAETLLKMQKNINNIDVAIKEKKDACLNFLKHSVFYDPLFTDLDTKISDLDENAPLKDNAYREVVRKMFELMSDENSFLKEKVSASHHTLEKILEVSSNIDNRVSLLTDKLSEMGHLSEDIDGLHKTLDVERSLLQEAEAERNTLKQKLDTLETMIKEEEIYLSDIVTFDSMYEDSDYSSISGGSEDHLMTEQTKVVCDV